MYLAQVRNIPTSLETFSDLSSAARKAMVVCAELLEAGRAGTRATCCNFTTKLVLFI